MGLSLELRPPPLRKRLFPWIAALLAAGCASANAPADPRATTTSPTAETEAAGSADLLPRARIATSDDVERLREIYRRRISGAYARDYPIGPGDLLEISVPAMAEIDEEVVRVGGDGTITLPLLGTMQAAGLTEQQLHDSLERGLRQFMYRPEFSLLVKEHHNRSVGVLGAVEDPGLHPVESDQDTILEMISKAGGLTDDATQRLLFIPVEAVSEEEAQRFAGDGPGQVRPVKADASALFLKASQPIVIDLEKMNRESQQLALSVPVRPGDTIMVLGGGKVFVQGWVQEPGAYPMTRGLTVLGAISAAGGFSFPAKRSRIQVLREVPGSDSRDLMVVNVEDIEAGHGRDIPLREGDIIEVGSAGGKLAAYGVYHFFTNVMRTGLALSPF